MANHIQANRLTGLNPLSYMGVNPYTPPGLVINTVVPTANDWQNFSIGTIWIATTEPQSVWILVSVAEQTATWLELDTNAGPGIIRLLGDNGQTATGVTVSVAGGNNINTAGNNGAILTINLDETVIITGNFETTDGNFSLPLTNTGGTLGIISWGGVRTVSAVAGANYFFGNLAGNPALTGLDNTGMGNSSLSALTSANDNSSFGSGSGESVTSGSGNTLVGANAGLHITSGEANVAIGCDEDGVGSLSSLVDGSYNIAIGRAAATAYTTNESSNIIIGNVGVITESNVIRIGTQGDGDGQQNKCYIAGIYEVSTGSTQVVTVNADGQLGSDTFEASGIVTLDGDTGSSAGATVTIAGDGTNITTTGDDSTTITVSLNNNVTISGNFTSTAGNLIFPYSTNTPTGIIEWTNGTKTYNGIIFDATLVNLFFGSGGNLGTQTGTSNIGIGFGNDMTIGPLAALTSGSSNISIGYSNSYSITSGSNNISLGTGSLAFTTTQSYNIAIGYSALGTGSGNYNIAIGYDAGNSTGSGNDSNIFIGNVGDIADSNVIRIGTQGSGNAQQDACYIAGIYGVTVGGTGTAVYVDNTGNLGTVVSSRRYKDNIEDIDDESSRILDLRPVSFTYKKQDPIIKHYGLIAEEVDEVYPELVSRNGQDEIETVKYHDLPVLILNELKKLEARVTSLEAQLKKCCKKEKK